MMRKMWFGTKKFARWIKVHSPGSAPASIGFTGRVDYLSGGVGIRRSLGGHEERQLTWNRLTEQEAREITDYAYGIYGDGPFYLSDPGDQRLNVLNKNWSTPGLSGKDGVPLAGTKRPTLVPNLDQSHGYPVDMAQYALDGSSPRRSFYVPIPPGHTAWVGAHGDEDSTGRVRVQPTMSGVAAGTPTDIPVVGVDTDQRVTHSFPATSDQAGVEISLAPAESVTNLFTNPSFEAGAGTVTVYENLFTDPEFAPGPGTVEVRRNLNPTPDWSQAFTGWATSNMTDEGAVPGGRAFSGTYTLPNINRLSESALTMPSTQFMQGWKVKVADTSAPVTFVNRMVADSTNIRKTGVTVQPGDEAYIAHIFEPVAGQASFRPVLEISNPDGAAFEFTVLDGVTVESTAIVRPAFSPGIPTPDPDLTPSWTGAANASPSILSGTPVAGVATNQCVAIRSSKVVNGVAYPLRLIPTSSANSTFVRISVPTAAHAGGTLIATRYQDAPLTGSLHGANYNIRVDSPTHTVTRTNIAGPVENRLVFGALSGTYEAYLAHGGAQDSGDVWYRAVGIFAGDYTGPFFSGDTPHPDPDFTTSWVGAANASVSRVTAAAIPEIGGAAVRYRSSHWAASGSNSMRVQRPSAGDVYVTVPTPGITLGKTYTIMFTTRVAEPIVLDRAVTLQHQSGAWPYIPLLPTGTVLSGVQEHRFTVTVPAGGQWTNANSIRLVLRPGSAVNGSGVWYDSLALVEGEYDGPYFDGRTAGAQWDGAADASTSTLVTRYVTLAGMIVQVLPNGEVPQPGGFISGQGMSGADFEGVVRATPYSYAHDSYGLSVKLVETEEWL